MDRCLIRHKMCYLCFLERMMHTCVVVGYGRCDNYKNRDNLNAHCRRRMKVN